MFDVLCVSDCCCDVIFKGMKRIPAPGTEEYCEELYMKAGGGANTAMGLAKSGCLTAYMTAVGEDDMGKLVCSDMEKSGVAADYIQKSMNSRTWVSAVLSTPWDRSFASYAGTRVSCTKEQLKQAVRNVKWLHTYTYYCELFPFLPEVCREAGVPFSVDAAFGEETRLENIRELLRRAELFTPNDVEACGLTKETDPVAALKKLAEVCPNVVVTMGGKGSIAVLDGKMYRAFPPEVTMVDANGAGDMFVAGLIAARLKGRNALEQLCLATASGALAVTYPGGMSDLYTRERVELLAENVIVKKM